MQRSKEIEAQFMRSQDIDEVKTLFSEYVTLVQEFHDETEITVEDILTEYEKQLIDTYEKGIEKAWTKEGVDEYHRRIMNIITAAKERYANEKV